MTKYISMHFKSVITNPYLIFWAICFIEFWVLLWAYVFGAAIPHTFEALRAYAGTAFGNLQMLSISSAASGITMASLYASKSIRYVTKYTKLSPSKFLMENLLSSLAVLLVISGIMFVSVLAVFSQRFGLTVLPNDGLGLSFAILLGALFQYCLSLFLSFLIVFLRVPRFASFLSFLPLILGFIPYTALWVDFKLAAYVSPLNCITSLCYYYYVGERPPTGNFFMPGEKTLVDINLALLSLTAWLITLAVLDVLLLKKTRGISTEELRAV